jgi:hypothetical protein
MSDDLTEELIDELDKIVYDMDGLARKIGFKAASLTKEQRWTIFNKYLHAVNFSAYYMSETLHVLEYMDGREHQSMVPDYFVSSCKRTEPRLFIGLTLSVQQPD